MKTVSRFVPVLFAASALLALAACSEAKTPPAPPAPPVQPAPAQVAPAAAPAPAKTAAAYPLATCPISGEKLGEMGPAVVKVYDGEEVHFCCKNCPPKFEKDLAANLAKVKADKAKAQAE